MSNFHLVNGNEKKKIQQNKTPKQTNRNVNHILFSLGDLPVSVVVLNSMTIWIHYLYLKCMIYNGQNNRNKKLALTFANIDSFVKYKHFMMT